MKKFLEFYKSLKEDRIVTKEEDGGISAPTGDVSTPPQSDSGDVISNVNKNGGLSTDDVLGHCDHKKDGFFGPGCFHRPFAVFTVPLSRIKKRKKKHLKAINLCEDEEFNVFQKTAESKLNQIIDSINTNTLSKIDNGITLDYNKEYDFSDEKEDWVAAYDSESDDIGKIRIGVNIPVLYNFLYENGMESDEKELECQLKACLYHELAHGLIQYFIDTETFDFELSDSEEEQIAEDFAKFQLKQYTGTTYSKLQSFLKEIYGISTLSETRAKTTDIQSKVPPTFSKPINIKNRRIVSDSDIGKILAGDLKIKSVIKGIEISEDDNILTDGEKILKGKVSFYEMTGSKKTLAILREKIPVRAKAEGDLEEYFSKLPKEKQELALKVIDDFDTYLTDEENKETNEMAYFLYDFFDGLDDEGKSHLKNTLTNKFIKDPTEFSQSATYFYPTLIDVVRICHNKVNTIPAEYLIAADQMDAFRSYNSFIKESIYDDFERSRHFSDKPQRKKEVEKMYGSLRNIESSIEYELIINKKTVSGNYEDQLNIITHEGVMFGYTDDRMTHLTTVFFCEPCDIAYYLREAYRITGRNRANVSNVSTDFLWNCLENIKTGRCHLDNNSLLPADNRRYIEVDD